MLRPESARHPVQRWVDASNAARRGEGVVIKQEAEHLYSTILTGDLKALSCLAFDVYTLRHAQSLPEPLIKRLRHDEQFQGARYEIAVAAVFVRAGYEIDWLASRERKVPEFVARHPSTGTEIAVEAKSRHRAGVLGRNGEVRSMEAFSVDVLGLMKRALLKETDGRPLVVCLDLNIPTEQAGSVEDWIAALNSQLLEPLDASGTNPFSAVFLTNYSWHWDGGEQARNPLNFVVRALDAPVHLPANELDVLGEALFQYGNVPERAARKAA